MGANRTQLIDAPLSSCLKAQTQSRVYQSKKRTDRVQSATAIVAPSAAMAIPVTGRLTGISMGSCEVGVRINIDVLNAEQQVYSTRRDLAKARYDTLMAQLRLKAAVGPARCK